MRLGRLLLIWRIRGGLTVKAAAGRIGINPSTLRRIEQGESMHGDTLTTLLVWLMGREEPSGNEAFTFEAEETAAVDNAGDQTDAEEAGQVDVEAAQAVSAAIADKQETAEEPALHALDQDPAVCGVRAEQLGGGAHGSAWTLTEGAG